MKKTLCVASVLATLIGTANAADYQNKAFIGASLDRMSVDSTFKEDGEKLDNIGGKETKFSGSINAGYKAYFLEQGNGSFFITPELSFNPASIEKNNSQNTTIVTSYTDTYSGSPYTSVTTTQKDDYNKYTVKPLLAFDLAFGYEFNQKHSVFAGLGLQYAKYDYKYSFNDTIHYETTGSIISSGDFQDIGSNSKSGHKLGYRTFVGYEYNLTNTVSLNTKLSYSYIEPKIEDIKAETDIVDFSIGAKYNF